MQLSVRASMRCGASASGPRPAPCVAARPGPARTSIAPCRRHSRRAWVAAASEAAPAVITEAKRQDLIRGCQIILQELKGLDFSRTEARKYFKLVALMPKGTAKDFEFSRARACLEQLLDSSAEEYAGPRDALEDAEALQVTQNALSEIWRWRRRGGGMNDEDDRPPHQHALQDIQNVDKEDIDRITSSLLDSLPLSDRQKGEMAGAVEQAALAGINGAVWGSMVFCLLLLLGFNFLRQ